MSVQPQTYDLVPIDQVSPHPANPRRGNVDEIAQSIASNGFYGALIVQRSTGHVLAGNHRLRAAQQVGLAEVPVVWVDVDDDRAMRILLVDNRANDLAGYDEEQLIDLLRTVDDSDGGLVGTGYSVDDLVDLLKRHEPPDLDALADELGEPDPMDRWPVVKIPAPPHVVAAWQSHLDTFGGRAEAALAKLLGVDPEVQPDPVWQG